MPIADRFLDHPYELAGRFIDPLPGILTWQGQTTHLRRKELEVLAMLASSPGATVSRQAFVTAVWDGNDLVGDRGVSDTIFSLRRALHDDDAQQPLIRTIPRRGYQLMTSAQPVVAQQPAFVAGGAVPGCPGWRLSTRLGESAVSESWLAQSDDKAKPGQRVFRFCRSEAHLRRLQREITLLRYLSECLSERKDLLIIRDWQLDEPPYYLARDYVHFGSLSDWATAIGGLAQHPLSARVAMMASLANALAAVHEIGVVHRNLSASSIFVDQSDAGPALKLGAFGLSALIDRSPLAQHNITALGLTLGVEEAQLAPSHAPPNWQAGAELSAADDIYALGIVLLQLSCGDLQAQPNDAWVDRVTDIERQTLLRRCFGPADARPSAAAIAAQFGRADDVPVAAELVVAPVAALTLSPQSPELQAQASPVSGARPANAPEQIGNYRLLDRLGEGGMGSVYLAEQREPYRKVALKVIRSGLDGKQILGRFEAERQALAMMNHPNVATVLDSGLADDGRPFFAMEYIAGEDITTHCDTHNLTLKARIGLYLQVCDGVLHAHQKGVLHRDLKPSNVMVSEARDGSGSRTGTVKIIDFGLAKSLHGRLSAHTLHTSFGAFVGTPIYSSPEHISGAASVDTRSDIYSLGVVLYELLAGVTPITNESLQNLEAEKVRELVCKSKLPSMCEQLEKTTAEKRSAIAEHRSTKLDELPRTLEGDLSWVVGKCLERDPNDRYASVLELKKDLERWLDLRPVEARPTSRGYRFRKLLRRHRGTSILIAASVAGLLLTTTAAVIGFVRAERALELSRAATLEGNLAADFQVKQLQSLDPAAMGIRLRDSLQEAIQKRSVDRGWNAEAVKQSQEHLDRLLQGVNFTDLALNQLDVNSLQPAIAAIKNDFDNQSLLRARLAQTMADTLIKLGLRDAAQGPQSLALEHRQRLLGEDDPLTLISLRTRGHINSALGKYDAAVADVQSALFLQRRVLGQDHPETLITACVLSQILKIQGKFKAALTLQSETLMAQRRVLGSNHRDTLNSMGSFITLLLAAGENEQALRYAKESLQSHRKVLGENHPNTMVATERLAQAYWSVGKISAALPLVRHVAEARRQLLGERHPRTLEAIGNLAVVFLSDNRPDKAETLLRQMVESQLKIFGADYKGLLTTRENIGGTLAAQERWCEADIVYREVHDQHLRTFGAQHPVGIRIAEGRATALFESGNLPEATTLFRQVLTDRRQVLGLEHRDTLRSMYQLAKALATGGKLDAADSLFQETLAIQKRALGKTDADTFLVLCGLGELAFARGDLEQAEALLRESLTGTRNAEVQNGGLHTLAVLASVLRERGALKEALTLEKEWIEAAPNVIFTKSVRIGSFLTQHSMTLTRLGQFHEAEQTLEQARMSLAQSNSPTKKAAEELIQAHIDLYAQWRNAGAKDKLDAKAEKWRVRLAQLRANGQLAAAFLKVE